ncbi:PREDICTED: uncharacterized protein LOC109174789 [Ipomoea nil]|uniref:uncharacterized protein LOC109174789 n=1 Tax=Ipomoea nil TaxID=35883 RepID=UPI0009016C68|nr:PREDICTED: uncharacterized protein LOC109174789 [Ipomoea nil]
MTNERDKLLREFQRSPLARSVPPTNGKAPAFPRFSGEEAKQVDGNSVGPRLTISPAISGGRPAAAVEQEATTWTAYRASPLLPTSKAASAVVGGSWQRRCRRSSVVASLLRSRRGGSQAVCCSRCSPWAEVRWRSSPCSTRGLCFMKKTKKIDGSR